jgi:hypothetical protein
MRQNDGRVLVESNDWRAWISARMQELQHDYPLCPKKDCWRAAQNEWLELRRRLKRELKEESPE